MNRKRYLTALPLSREEVVTRLRQLNGFETDEITAAHAWEIAEELFACGCSLRFSDRGYTASSHESGDITGWDSEQKAATP